MALAQVGGAGRGSRVLLALEDRLLRESLAMALAQEGFRILEFASAEAALSRIEAGTEIDALVVEARGEASQPASPPSPGSDDEPRARLRSARCACPVYLLGSDGDAHAAAQGWGAVGIIDRTQPIASLKRNLINAIRAGALLAEPGAGATADEGPLVFSAEGARVSWKGCHLDLDATERALLSGLVAAPQTGLTTRRAQAILSALDEPEGGPDRVKSLVRRIRKKFREVDPDFDEIAFVPGRGYSWRRTGARSGEAVR